MLGAKIAENIRLVSRSCLRSGLGIMFSNIENISAGRDSKWDVILGFLVSDEDARQYDKVWSV
ncbi:hypothetical protein BJ165DRAFT_1487386 [Panaeolus papilionaceus]|nr:hypothetical protein BJ165DRAFT_1487386 [Panaeolus papilionaceus]